MPRHARKKSGSGYEHVIICGINNQILFNDDTDRSFFLLSLARYSSETGVGVIAYCLMENHAHFLLFASNGNIPLLMKKIGVSYAMHFNRKYNRTGQLFKGRYKSEPIENNSNLLRTFRFILQNPEKAGICPASVYPWSSFRFYGDRTSFIDTAIIEMLLGDFKRYEDYLSEEDTDRCLEYTPHSRDDRWAKNIIRNMLSIDSGTELQRLGKEQRDSALRKLKAAGITVRQLERLTGINRGVIQRA